MKKLFIFRKQLTANSVVTDNQGLNLDFLAIPADSLANISAIPGKIILSFKDGNDFSDSGLSNSSSTTLRFCNVTVSIVTGKEYSVVQALWDRAYKNADSTIVFDNTSDKFFNDNVLRIESIVRSESPAFASSSDVPPGGDTFQVLTKQSAADGDVDWEYLQDIYLIVENASGGPLTKATPVHVTGENGNGNPTVIAARADTPSTMPANYILAEPIANGAEGLAFLIGRIQGVNTSAFSAGDVVYVGPTGGYTTTKPTGTNLIQNLGIVTAVDAINGGGWIYGAGRTNDVPNLPSGKFFIGSATNTQESAYTLPTADGTAGQVLATDGSGSVAFKTLLTQVTSITVLQASWSLVSGLYEYDISDSNILATSIVDVIPANADYATVVAAQLLPENVSSSGQVKIFAVNQPTVDFDVTINIFN